MTMTHDELVTVARSWLIKSWRRTGRQGARGGCSVVLSELTSSAFETPDAIGWCENRSFLIECKVSRSDFRADTRKFVRRNAEMGVGNFRYYMAPVGLILPQQLPTGWGLIEVNESMRARVVVDSGPFQPDRDSELRMMLSLLRRLDIPNGKHAAIRSYTIKGDREPRAKVTMTKPVPVPVERTV